MNFVFTISVILSLCFSRISSTSDKNGYIAYCPCMGRFGNQAEQFLGSLAFAKSLNRTLVLPPWVEYRTGETKSIQIPFDEYFKVESLQKYHRVILMSDFMERIAPEIWPPEKRTVFCYVGRGNKSNDCHAKEGNPFGPFWDTFSIDFVNSEIYGPLNYDVHYGNMNAKWNSKYPADKFPVLAFTGAPASFPIQKENRALQKYLKWNERMKNRAQRFVAEHFPRTSYLGVHLRNGIDWTGTCDYASSDYNLFSSPQCLGYQNEHGPLTKDICFPSQSIIIEQVKLAVKNFNGTTPIRSLFVASDFDHMLSTFEQHLRPKNVSVFKLSPPNPHLDLIILSMSNHFIGNCVSSFSSFVKRQRDVHNFPSEFWAFRPHSAIKHDPNEL